VWVTARFDVLFKSLDVTKTINIFLHISVFWKNDKSFQWYWSSCMQPHPYQNFHWYPLTSSQARRQDLAAGGPKTRRRGQKLEGGAKNQKGGHIFKIHYWMYVATRGPNVKWGGTDFKLGGRAPLPPRWRRPRQQQTHLA